MNTIALRHQTLGDLRERASSQAQMKAAIIDRLLEGMPDDYSSEDINVRAAVVFQYVQQQMHSAMVH